MRFHGREELRLESLMRRVVHPLRPRRWGLLVLAVIPAELAIEPRLSRVRPVDRHLSSISLFDGLPITEIDGLPASASRLL